MKAYIDAEIPIRNIYYMLCYAWDRLKEKDLAKVGQLEYKNIWDLLSRVLSGSLGYLIKKGFYREYKSQYEETSTLKGKINFNDSLKRNTFIYARAFCSFDEFSYDILYNQIIKATIYNLLRSSEVSEENKERLMSVYHYFTNISDVSLSKRLFREPMVYKNNAYYGFLLDICELIYDNLLVDEESGRRQFKDFIRDEREMAYLFENFVRNFYRRELNGYKVFREDIRWNAYGESMEYLPKMQTDVSLLGREKKVVIDTKYYKDALSTNYGREKIISNNLYQLFAYLKNNEHKSELDSCAEGVLLYPQVGRSLDLEYEMSGHRVRICTVNLDGEWQDIHERLLVVAG